MLKDETRASMRTSSQFRESADSDQGAFVITPLRSEDLDAVAQTHIASFGDSFLATMGVPFLRHYFRTFLGDSRSFGRVCSHRQTGEVVGFVCGSENVSHFYRYFLTHRLLPATPAIASRVLSNWQLATAVLQRAWRVGRILVSSRFRKPDKPSSTRVALPPASLMTIGVHPQYRRKGIGEMLVRAFMSEMDVRGVHEVKLGVRNDNAAARRLYERLGWRPAVESSASSSAGSGMYVRAIRTCKTGVHDEWGLRSADERH